MQSSVNDGQIATVRRFNRFYTRRIGVLQEHLHQSPFSLSEARVLFEIARKGRTAAVDLAEELDLDPGYLSRILRAFERKGLLSRDPSSEDGRKSILSLTQLGQDAFRSLDAASTEEVRRTLEQLTARDRERLTRAMRDAQRILGDEPPRGAFVLRGHRPGDMGWVVQRHGENYWEEYSWDETFEALVAQIVADFVRNLKPDRERCWIAEADGERLGCVFLVRNAEDPDRVAQLRLLLVEPGARGAGLGSALVRSCTQFARQAGYERIRLWTNDVLHAARRIYENEGYRLVHQGPHHGFGHDLVEQTWELEL